MYPLESLPRFHKRLFRLLCREELYNELAGDLEESFVENYTLLGADKARSIYKREVLKMLRPSVMKTLRFIPRFTPLDMIKNYLKLSFRNLIRDKEHSLVSIIGLAAGIVASVLIFQFVNFEDSYDSLHNEEDGRI